LQREEAEMRRVGARDKELCTRTEGGIKLEEARVWTEMEAVRRIEEEEWKAREGYGIEEATKNRREQQNREKGLPRRRNGLRRRDERRKKLSMSEKRRRNLRKASEISTTDADWRSACITLKDRSSPISNRPQLDTL
jgi:hypothetical protein